MATVKHSAPGGNVLVRNAVALMFSTVGSAALGMAFWAVAARLYRLEEVGRASAEVAAVTFVAGLAQVGLTATFTRFLPVAERATGRLLRAGYGLSIGVAAVLAAGFVGFGFTRAFMTPDAFSLAIFTGAAVLYAVFAMQDGVMMAFRRAPWVPTENLAVALARLLLLPVLLVTGARFAVFTSWLVPTAGAVVAVSVLVFGRLAPAQQYATPVVGPPLSRRELLDYACSQYVGGVVGAVVTLLPPVLVASRLGSLQNAYFYFPWLFSTACSALLWNIVFSLVVEAAHNIGRTRQLLARASLLGGLVTGFCGLVLGLGAPLILSIIGSTYASGGATSLRLIGLSLPFTGINMLYSALSLIQKRTWIVTMQQAAAAVLFIGLSFPEMDRMGATGMALAFLISRVFIAVTSVPGIVKRYRAVVRSTAAAPAPEAGRTPSTQDGAGDRPAVLDRSGAPDGGVR